ncbi:hypothetical protein DY000_02040303 [Brassica cretica]|uniref:FBD domain-containing protein n=1 Tax=Brassica cretica TaxID=69181 RepID=A0ABQ7B6F9_BRACR|nr:hypothetical protein DY000_02040303 [Brassica cretica]
MDSILKKEVVFLMALCFSQLSKHTLIATGYGADYMFDSLISGCPVLEELFLRYGDGPHGSDWIMVVSSRSIKRLTISSVRFLKLDWDLRLWESPIEFNFDYENDVYDDGFGDVTILVAGLSNVKTLHLSPHSLEGLAHKVTDKCGDVCACILQKKEVGECCLWRCQVKVLEITGYGGSSKELKQMGHFLEKLKRLVIVKVGVQQENNNHDLLPEKLSLRRCSVLSDSNFMTRIMDSFYKAISAMSLEEEEPLTLLDVEMISIYEKRKTCGVEYDEEAIHGVVILVTRVTCKGAKVGESEGRALASHQIIGKGMNQEVFKRADLEAFFKALKESGNTLGNTLGYSYAAHTLPSTTDKLLEIFISSYTAASNPDKLLDMFKSAYTATSAKVGESEGRALASHQLIGKGMDHEVFKRADLEAFFKALKESSNTLGNTLRYSYAAHTLPSTTDKLLDIFKTSYTTDSNPSNTDKLLDMFKIAYTTTRESLLEPEPEEVAEETPSLVEKEANNKIIYYSIK